MNNRCDVINKDHFDEVDKENGEGEREGRVVEALNGLPFPAIVRVHGPQEDGNAAHENLMKKVVSTFFEQQGFNFRLIELLQK